MNAVDSQLLGLLAEAPFIDRLELAALSGRSRAAVYQSLDRLAEAGLVDSIGHASEHIARTQRYSLTANGVRRLAQAQDRSVAQLLRDLPVSHQWRRLMLDRLDAAAVVYRLAERAAQSVWPLRLQWYRAAPMDAALELPSGAHVALARQGRSVDRSASAKRLRRLDEQHGFAARLLVCPDETRLRQARRNVRSSSTPTYLTIERELLRSWSDASVWRPSSGAGRLTLPEALRHEPYPASPPTEPPLNKVSLPRPLTEMPTHPSRLSAAEKRALDLIADWPWIRPAHLTDLLGVGERRCSWVLSRLTELGLVTRLERGGRPRLALSDRGLAAVARRDRASVGRARQRWSAAGQGGRPPSDWREARGLRSRQLLRHLEHTESVHGFAAALSRQATERGLSLVQLDPPQRASRYFRLVGRLRSIHPDAYALLADGRDETACFLEWERRAVRPSTMTARLGPYLRYFASGRPIEDHGLPPHVMIVFEVELTAGHFLRLAERAMAQSGVEPPLLVSDRRNLRREGPLGPVWRSVGGGSASPLF